MSGSEEGDDREGASVDTDTLESQATADNDGGERYHTLSANKSGEVTTDEG